MNDAPPTHINVKALAGLHVRLRKTDNYLVVSIVRKARRARDLDVLVCMVTAPITDLRFTKVRRDLGENMSLWLGGAQVIELPEASAQKAAKFLGIAIA